MSSRTDYLKKFMRVEDNIDKYTADYPSRRRNKLLKDIEKGMKSLLKDSVEQEDKQEYNRILKKLLDYYSDSKFEEAYKDKSNKPRTPEIEAIPMEQVEIEIEKDTKEEALKDPEVQRKMEKAEREAMAEEELETREMMKEGKNRERNRKRRERKRGADLLREINEMTKKLEETKKEQEKTIKKLKKEKEAKKKAELEKEIERLEMRNKEIKEEIIREIDDEEERKEDVESEDEEDVDEEEMDLADIEDVDEEEMDLADIEDVDEEEMDLADIEDVDVEEMDLADIEDVDVEEMDLADIEDVEEEKKKDEEEEKLGEISPEMEEFHNQIRKEEREKVMREFNLVDSTIGSIDIPKERLGVEGKTIKILNDDIKYFLNRFPDMLKMEADVYKKTNKKNKKVLQDIHRRIQAKLSPDPKKEEEGKKVGIILDADKFIDMKISELLATKTLEGLTPANLVDITEEPKSEGRDVGSYTITRKGGRDIINNAPVYRSIPTTQPQKPKRKGEIKQSTIYDNSGKTKVDIARMEMRDNPFIRETKPKRLNIIL